MIKKSLCILLAALFLISAASCAAENGEDGMSSTSENWEDGMSSTSENGTETEKTVYTGRETPLRKDGETMKVLISDPPGEDPFIVTKGAAPDPFVTYDPMTDYYYGMSTQNSEIVLHRSRVLSELFTGGESKKVYWTGTQIFDSLWAPEMYYMDGLWYIYSSGTEDPRNPVKRLFVLVSKTSDPFDGFRFKSYIDNSIFGIDPTVYIDDESGKRYLCFSEVIDGLQWLSIAELKKPWKIGPRTAICDPRDYEWDGMLNEGPFFVKHGKRLFIIYSACGCYDDNYKLGLLEYKGGDMLGKENWEKHPEPIFVKNPDACVFAPGHASFFTSPDLSETWIAYQCFYSTNAENPARRRMRVCHVQPISFDETGFPVIGEPLSGDSLIPVPSGE